MTARSVGDRLRKKLRRSESRSLFHVLLHVFDRGLHRTECGAESDACFRWKLFAAIVDRQPGSRERITRQRVHPPKLLDVDEVARLEVANQGGRVRAEADGVESIDRHRRSTTAFEQPG